MPETVQPLQFVKLRTHFATNILRMPDGNLAPTLAI